MTPPTAQRTGRQRTRQAREPVVTPWRPERHSPGETPNTARAALPLLRAATAGPRPGDGRPQAESKFLAVAGQRLWVRGVTYGTFAPGADGHPYPDQPAVERDFAAMAANGINAVRTYTVPPRWLLELAERAGLWVLVGLAWEQHVAFLGERGRADAILATAREQVASCAGHPAILCYAVGNEIPASIVRWHGRRRIERFLDGLCAAVRRADPGSLVAYVNYPTTEYVRVDADIVAFNVYLESRDRFGAYLARLQNLAGDRPLLLTELGLDSSSEAGQARQARTLGWQIRDAFDGGCAGTFVFAWTDEWHRGGHEVLDWDFGLTDRDRAPKPALAWVAAAFEDAPPLAPADAEPVSVVVCTHNGAATLRECLQGAFALDYPQFEVIVVDDGSTDASAAIARELGARLISTPNRGLSSARNTGLHAATGTIVAYLDDDAWPDPNWLTHLTHAFRTTDRVAVGGPNVPPADEPEVAACVANAPGGPVHVLLSDTEAEHLPGCNMAFRREALLACGGFDPQFRAAGDDVDICWRLQEEGGALGFHPAAVVWHRRRPSISRFWRQQVGYGRAEALLERKWPQKYNAPGHSTWAGRLYGRGTAALGRRSHVYHGTWGMAPFQGEVTRTGGRLAEFAGSPDWYLVLALLGVLSALGSVWKPLLAIVPLLGLATAATIARAARGSLDADLGPNRSRPTAARMRVTIFLLHLLQPAARLSGRSGEGLVPWRRPRSRRLSLAAPRTTTLWSERWLAPDSRIARLQRSIRERGGRVQAGGGFDRWDLQIWGGALGAVRVRAGFEEHGDGRQLVRFALRPWIRGWAIPCAGLVAAAGVAAAGAGAWIAACPLLAGGIWLAAATVYECCLATGSALDAIASEEQA